MTISREALNEIHATRQLVADMIESPKHDYNPRTKLSHLFILRMLNKKYDEIADLLYKNREEGAL